MLLDLSGVKPITASFIITQLTNHTTLTSILSFFFYAAAAQLKTGAVTSLPGCRVKARVTLVSCSAALQNNRKVFFETEEFKII